MNLAQLKNFLSLADKLNLKLAARDVFITESALSHSIKSLESSLGVQLFHRNPGKELTLTSEGVQLQPHAANLLEHAVSVQKMISNFPMNSAELSIACTKGLIADDIADAIVRILQSSENQIGRVKILTETSAGVRELVLARNVDVGVCFSPQTDPNLDLKTIYSGQLIVAVSEDLLVDKKNFSLADLEGWGRISPISARGVDDCLHHPVLEEHNLTQKPCLETNDYQTCITALKSLKAWAFIPDFLCQNKSNRIHKMPLPDSWQATYTIDIVTRRDRQFSAKFHKLIMDSILTALIRN